MRVCIIVNQNAGSADLFEELGAEVDNGTDFDVRISEEKNHSIELAREASEEGFDVVAAAGGDGTVHDVVNGIMDADRKAVLGIIPLGTGNDLARALNVPIDPVEAIDLLRSGARRPIDLFTVDTVEGSVYGINAAAGGFSGQVDEAVTTELKANWGPLAYLIGAASVIPDLQEYASFISYDGGELESVNALNVIVANGRTVAGGKRVSPLSNPEDGLLDVVIVEKGTVVELGDAATRLIAGGFLKSAIVSHRRARSIRIESEPPMWFNVDGELITRDSLQIEVAPGAIRVVVGPGYRAVITP